MVKKVFNIISDIHLEFFKHNSIFDLKSFFNKSNSEINDVEYNLILAGDIGYPTMQNYKIFLNEAARLYNNVWLISGNHEYYITHQTDLNISDVDKMIEEICTNSNVHYLNNKMIQYDNIYMIGTTLWTNIPEDAKKHSFNINDYNCINNFSADKTNEIYQSNLKFLKDSLSQYQDKLKLDNDLKCMVISHHMPSFDLIHPKYKSFSDINYFFASDLNDLIKDSNIDYWIYGHTHTGVSKQINKTQLMANPLGYVGENLNFSPLNIMI